MPGDLTLGKKKVKVSACPEVRPAGMRE